MDHQASEQPVYTPKKETKSLVLTSEQKTAVSRITQNITTVDASVLAMAQNDIITTLQNGHPLNRLITNHGGEVTGYIACADDMSEFGMHLEPDTAYIKYFGTNEQSGRSAFAEIPPFLRAAREHGYRKLAFHGWNDRLNDIMVRRYGFNEAGAVSFNGNAIKLYEKDLEAEQIAQINKAYEATLARIGERKRPENERLINETLTSISVELSRQENFTHGPLQQAILRFKLARYFELKTDSDLLDTNVLRDAILETPAVIQDEQSNLGIAGLLKLHKQKTAQWAAQLRTKQGETHGVEPEQLLVSASGEYQLVRLLNKTYLEQESATLNHCVGNGDTYLNKIKKGEREILSFRRGNTPLMTIEYDPKHAVIEQMKKSDDEYLAPTDPYTQELFIMLGQLPKTKTIAGKPRMIKRINATELQHFTVAPDHILTPAGEVHFRTINPNDNPLILKVGTIELIPDITEQDAAQLLQIFEGIHIDSHHIARTPDQIIDGQTVAYIGKLGKPSPATIQKIQHLKYVYTSFPDGRKLTWDDTELSPSTRSPQDEIAYITAPTRHPSIGTWGYAQTMMKNPDYAQRNTDYLTEKAQHDPTNNPDVYIELSLEDLGVQPGQTVTWQGLEKIADEWGLEKCPPGIGPALRVAYQDQPVDSWSSIYMEPIAVSVSGGDQNVFTLSRSGGHLGLGDSWTGSLWHPHDRLVVQLRKYDS